MPVLVVGGGPVGLTCAMSLAKAGVRVMVVEERAPLELPEPRCNHVSARSMEVFRRLGLSRQVRERGLPTDYPHDVVYATRFSGMELGRVRIPSRADRFNDEGYADGGWPTAEPPHRINQTYLEPVMFRKAMSFEQISVRCNYRVESVEQQDGFVRVHGKDLLTGESDVIDALYMVGCDGSRSAVRRALGIELQGNDNLMRSMMATITAPELRARATYDPAWMYWLLNPKQSGNIIALDGKDRWIVNAFLPPGTDEATFDFEAAVRTLLGNDVPFSVEHKKTWVGRRLLAERFRERNVFLSGDAAHSWLPMGGYAMNAGIADADNLSWKLAAVIRGWAEPGLLESYEAERRPVLDQVSSMVMRVRKNNDFTLPPEIEDTSETGQAARERVGRFMLETDSAQFACIGLNFGYYYNESPCVAYDDGPAAPSYSVGSYTPSISPGCRAPHCWLEPGTSLYDRLGNGYALLRLNRAVPTLALEAAARDRGVPLSVIDLEPDQLGVELHASALVLVRPDQHVAWRGACLPADVIGLIDRLRGATVPEQRHVPARA